MKFYSYKFLIYILIILIMNKTPAFVIIPDKTDEAGAGATGWAVGNHSSLLEQILLMEPGYNTHGLH